MILCAHQLVNLWLLLCKFIAKRPAPCHCVINGLIPNRMQCACSFQNPMQQNSADNSYALERGREHEALVGMGWCARSAQDTK